MDEDAPPSDGARRVGEAVAAIAGVTRGPLDAEAGGTAQEVSAPVPVYALGPPRRDSRPETVLSRAKRITWRYLALGAGPEVADLGAAASEHPVLDETPGLAARIAEAGGLAERSVDDPGYRIRLLDLPLIGHSFIWAADPGSAKPDRLFSISDQPREVDVAAITKRVSNAERQKAIAYEDMADEAGG